MARRVLRVRSHPTPEAPIPNIPSPTATFSYREALVAELSSLLANEATPRRRIALHGMGGAGKTQLAASWASARVADFDIAWWISASNDGNFDYGVRELGEHLGVGASAMDSAL